MLDNLGKWVYEMEERVPGNMGKDCLQKLDGPPVGERAGLTSISLFDGEPLKYVLMISHMGKNT